MNRCERRSSEVCLRVSKHHFEVNDSSNAAEAKNGFEYY